MLLAPSTLPSTAYLFLLAQLHNTAAAAVRIRIFFIELFFCEFCKLFFQRADLLRQFGRRLNTAAERWYCMPGRAGYPKRISSSGTSLSSPLFEPTFTRSPMVTWSAMPT